MPDESQQNLPCESRQESPALLFAAGGILSAIGILGLVVLLIIRKRGMGIPGPERYNVFYYLYGRHEAPFLILLVVFGILSVLVAALMRSGREGRIQIPFARFLFLLAVLVLLVTRYGEKTAMRDVGLSMDEFAAEFQSRIFASGQLTATVPSEWRYYAWAITPVFISYDPIAHTWQQGYLPVYAALRAAFVFSGLEKWTNPMFGAISILLIGIIARRLWPNEASWWKLAPLFLGLSSQFLLMSMTDYSYPAHLCLNLLWFYLYLRRDSIGYLLLPLVGVAALGLHNPFIHGLFAAPFLIAMVRSKSRKHLDYVITVYLLGSLAWLGWMFVANTASSDGGLLSVFSFPNRLHLFVQAADLSLLFSWQTPLAGILFIAAILSWRKLEPPVRLLGWSFALTFLFYFFYPLDQQHGWGYRFIFGALGNFTLLAVAGLSAAPPSAKRGISILVGATIAVTITLQAPIRLLEAKEFMNGFSNVLEHARSLPYRVVATDAKEFWYAQDFVRNGPFLREEDSEQVFVHLDRLSPSERRALRLAYRSVHVLGAAEAARFGFPPRSARTPDALERSDRMSR